MGYDGLSKIKWVDLSEAEAWMIIDAFNVAEMERGSTLEEREFISRLVSFWPSIQEESDKENMREKLWSEIVEEDASVKEIRRVIEDKYQTPTEDFNTNEMEALIYELNSVKTRVYNELAPQYGLEKKELRQ